MVQTANEIFRDFVTEGVPSSGAWEPRKAEIRPWGTRLENLYSAAQAGGGLAYETRAQMNADLAHDANQIAWVMEDPIVANNGIYQKVGASGSGSWNRVGDLPYSIIFATNTNGEFPDHVVATTSIPVTDSPYSQLISVPFTAANTGPMTLSINFEPATPLVTNTGQPIPAGYVQAGMAALVQIDTDGNYRLFSYGDASAIQAAAEAAADRAEAAAAGVNLPSVDSGEAGKVLVVKGDGSGYKFGGFVDTSSYFIVAAGQSNMAGSNERAALGGNLTPNERVFLWNGMTNTWGVWMPAETSTRYSTGGAAPAGHNNIAFQAAKAAQRQTGRDVYVVLNAWPGDPINNWVIDGAAQSNYTELTQWVAAAMATAPLAGKEVADVVLWAQGESDGTGGRGDIDGLLYYRKAFSELYALLEGETWVAVNTPMVCMQLPLTAGGGTLNTGARNDFYDHMGELGYATVGVAFTADLSRNYSDGIHFAGAAHDMIGARMVAVANQLPRPTTDQWPEVIERRLKISDPVSNKGFEIGATLTGVSYIAPLDFSTGGAADYTTWLTFNPAETAWVANGTLVFGGNRPLRQGQDVKINSLGGIALKGFIGAAFVEITHQVNTIDKAEGVAYWDTANDRLVVATGPNPGDPWKYFLPDSEYVPV